MSRHRAPEPEKEKQEGISPVAAIISILCVIGLAVTLVLMSGSDRVSGPMNLNGDFLGPDSDESVAAYAARAAESLSRPDGADGPDADGEGAGPDGDSDAPARHWGLVSFDPPADAATAAAAVDGIDSLRVGTMMLGPVVSRTLPEPTAGEKRIDVFDRELAHVARSAGPIVEERPAINGLIVYGTLEQLRSIVGRPGVAAVEALPADAVHGRFGVRPLVPMEDPAAVPNAPAPAPAPAPVPREPANPAPAPAPQEPPR